MATVQPIVSDQTSATRLIAVDSQHFVGGSKDPTIRIWQLH
ncbi:hypothetical protein [Phormidesmis priestleyi]|nr:hypothetical protein [Phormidesmis priestleyi]